MEKLFLKNNIDQKYIKLDKFNLVAYNAHLRLAKYLAREGTRLEPKIFKLDKAFQCEKRRKRNLLNKKLYRMKIKSQPMIKTTTLEVQKIPNFVINNSSETFTKSELELLNNEPNFAIDTTPRTKDIVIDVEGVTRNLDPESKKIVRKEVGIFWTREQQAKNKDEKDIFYTEADKGNEVVMCDVKKN
ncbi:unnamed protein product [Hermetia illucens]|uniref:Uncharacterized protein n=1 Tax=Hermetia illucens TaxID=343691 RepID=A0A7R8UVT4_HERIL|nr:unnamed protein product [Hermetia illucens]